MKKLLLIAFLVGCSSTPIPPSPPKPPLPDGPEASCADMCKNVRDVLHCKEGQNTAKGATCEAVCDNYQSSGITHRDLRCEASARSCEAFRACSP